MPSNDPGPVTPGDALSGNAEIVTMLRDAHGWTQSELAARANVSQGYVSKVESRLIELTGERLNAVATAFDAPVELLTARLPAGGLEVSCMFHRRRSSKITMGDGKRIEAIGRLTRITTEGLLRDLPRPAVGLRRLDIDEYESASHIARLARAEWRIPSGPLINMMDVLDDLGIATIVRDVGTAGQDAFSTWPSSSVPIVVVNTGLPTDRLRYSCAHELGHVVMHVLPNDQQEEQADEFASELLMPSVDIEPDLRGLTTSQFPRLLELKAKWRVSVGALVRKALTLDIISARQFKEFRIRLARMGWDKSEPVELPAERSHFLATVIEQRRTVLDENGDALARAALMTPASFRRHYLNEGQPSG